MRLDDLRDFKMLSPAATLTTIAAFIYFMPQSETKHSPLRDVQSPGNEVGTTRRRPAESPLEQKPSSSPVEIERATVAVQNDVDGVKPRRTRDIPPQMVILTSLRYASLRSQIAEAKQSLADQLKADPEEAETLRSKLRKVAVPVTPITLAQAFADPQMSVAMRTVLNDDAGFRDLREAIHKASNRVGLELDFRGARNPEELIQMLRAGEPEFQASYASAVRSMNVSEPTAQAVVRLHSGELLIHILDRDLPFRSPPSSCG